MKKWILHIDLNAFFASAEVIANPSLAGLPLAVGSSKRRGVISTASYEARAFGVHAGMPGYQAKLKCKDLIFVQGNYKLYQKLSNEFFAFVKTYCSVIEIASIDECYGDITDALQHCSNIRDFLFDMQVALFQKTKLKCSIGLSHSKFIAKMASDLQKPLGITIIDDDEIEHYLYDLPIRDFYGIGKSSTERLNKIGILTIRDFVAAASLPSVSKICGSMLSGFITQISGEGSDKVDDSPFDPKSISTTHTFLYDTNDYDEITDIIKIQCKELARLARKKNKVTKNISVIFRDDSFITTSKSIALSHSTSSAKEILATALLIIDKYYHGAALRLVGVSLNKVIDESDDVVQLNLFSDHLETGKTKTEKIVKDLNIQLNGEQLTTLGKLKKKEKI